MFVKSRLWSVFKRLNIHSVLALAGIAGPIVLGVTDIAASFTNPNYSLVRDSISSLALTRIGLLVEIFVAGLLFNIKGVRGFHFSIGLLVFFGFGLLLIGAFRTTPVGASRTIEGIIHSLTAYTVFWLFPIAVLLVAPSLRNDTNWKKLFIYTIVTGALALALVIGLLCLPDQMSWFGLYERILVANMIVWVEVTAIRLLLLSIRREPKAGKAA